MRDLDDPIDVGRRLRSALAKINRRLRAHERSAGVGPTALSLLGRLLRDGPATAATLAARERLQPQSLTRTLHTLEALKMIDRSTDGSDRRRSIISVTQAGIEALRTTARSREAWLSAAIASSLSGTERDVLRIAIALLERLADFDEAPDAVAPNDDALGEDAEAVD